MKNNGSANKKIKVSFSEILKNNRVLMIFSLLVSFCLWAWVSVEKSPITQKVISDVPITIDLSGSVPEQLNLQIFGEKEFKVDVTVSGKKYILANLTKDDVKVSAVTNYVDSSGSKTLQLKYSIADNSEEFEIVSLSTSYIEVYFDTFKQVEIPLQTNFTNDIDSLLPENCILGDIVFSKQTVLVSGPASEINRISKAVANVTLLNRLEKNTTVVPDIQLITEDGSSLVYSTIDKGDGDITMSIPILKIVTLPASVNFKNAPSNFVSNPLNYSVYPSTITAAIPIDLAETAKSVPIATIDFSEISNGINTFNISSNDITDVKVVSSTASRFKVTVDATEMSSKVITLPASNVKIINAPEGYSATVEDQRNIPVRIVGQADSLESIEAESVMLTADLQDLAVDGDTQSVPVSAYISNNKCWVQGKYEMKITLKNK